MKVLIFDHELFTFLNITALKEIFQLFLQLLEHPLQPHLQLLSLPLIRLFDTFVDLEYIHHELGVHLRGYLLQMHPLQLHEIDRPLEVVKQGSLRLVYVGRVQGHLLLK